MHQFTISGSVFDIDARYRPIKPIGSGAYGLVIAAHDADAALLARTCETRIMPSLTEPCSTRPTSPSIPPLASGRGPGEGDAT